jgi:hypothetical protein
MSASSYLSPRFPAMRVVAASVPIWTTFTGMFKDCMRGANDEMR